MIYFTLLSVVMLLFSFTKKMQNYVLPIFIFLLIILMAFRAESVGTDTLNYKTSFEYIKNNIILETEIGWILLNKTSLLIKDSYEFFLITVSVFTLLPIYFIIKRNSVNPMLTLFLYFTLYFYFNSFNMSRQMIAINFIFLGFTFLQKRKIWVYFLFVILAMLFHTSAFIALPIAFINKIPDNKKFILTSILIAFFSGLFLADYIFKLAEFTKYMNYIGSYELGNYTGTTLYLIVLNSFFLFVYFTSIKRDTYFKIFYIYILLSNLFIRIPYGDRIIIYLSIIQIIYLPYLIYNNKIKEKQLMILIIVIYAYVIFLRNFNSNYAEIFPYINRLMH